MPEPFVHRLRVRYHECDAQGIVFNANWFTYFDVTLVEGRTVYVFVEPASVGKGEIPAAVRERLAAYATRTSTAAW